MIDKDVPVFNNDENIDFLLERLSFDNNIIFDETNMDKFASFMDEMSVIGHIRQSDTTTNFTFRVGVPFQNSESMTLVGETRVDQLPLYDVLAGSYTVMSNSYIELSGVESISTLWEAIVVAVKDYSDSTGRSTLLLHPHSIKKHNDKYIFRFGISSSNEKTHSQFV